MFSGYLSSHCLISHLSFLYVMTCAIIPKSCFSPFLCLLYYHLELCNLVWQNKDHSWMSHHPVLISYMLPTGKAKHLCKLRVILMECNCINCHYTHYITERNRVFTINLCYKPEIPITFGLVTLSDLNSFIFCNHTNWVEPGKKQNKKTTPHLEKPEREEQNTGIQRDQATVQSREQQNVYLSKAIENSSCTSNNAEQSC